MRPASTSATRSSSVAANSAAIIPAEPIPTITRSYWSAAIAPRRYFAKIGFEIGDAFLSIGLVIQAIVNFVIVAFILFLIVEAYNKMKAEDEAAAGPTEVELLTEIRDALKNR